MKRDQVAANADDVHSKKTQNTEAYKIKKDQIDSLYDTILRQTSDFDITIKKYQT